MALKKSKRDIDKERMFTKIMPSLNEENEAEANSLENENTEKSAAEQTKENKVSETKNIKEEKSETKSETKPLNTPETVAVDDKKSEEVLKTESNKKPQQEKKDKNDSKKNEKTSAKKENSSKQFKVYNITEEMINSEIDTIFNKFNCCHCDICKCTIIADVLNNLPPKYIAAKPSELKKFLNKENNGNIKSAIIQSVFKVIANPPHKPV